jgi:hypothetical protein
MATPAAMELLLSAVTVGYWGGWLQKPDTRAGCKSWLQELVAKQVNGGGLFGVETGTGSFASVGP